MIRLDRTLLILATGAAIALASPASAQTTNCQWFGAVWTCNQSPAPQPRGNVFQGLPTLTIPPDISRNVMESYERGVAEREAREQAKIERQRIQAERDYYRSQTAPVQSAPAPRVILPQMDFVATLPQRQEIGAILKSGNCKAAIDRALELGDIQLATNIKEFCAGAAVKSEP